MAAEEVDAASARVAMLAERDQRTRAELDAIGDAIEVTTGTMQKLDAEIAALARDREGVREAMIAAAREERALSSEIARVEEAIVALSADEAGIKDSLHARRGVLAEVLAALQRMGRKPPPALLVKPEDALGSVRSAILLGAVVPEMRGEMQRLLLELRELARLRSEIDAQKATFVETMARKREEEGRLARLFAEKERLEADGRRALEEANRRAQTLAEEAGTLQDLIAGLEGDLDAARQAEAAAIRLEEERAVAFAEAEAARRLAASADAERVASVAIQREAAAARGKPQEAVEETVAIAVAPSVPSAPVPPPAPTYDVASLRRDMVELQPGAAFSTLKGILTAPVGGRLRTAFGADDGLGRPSTGMTFTARAGDVVVAPSEGRVLFSGPFRSYGQLLILNVGDGYHVVLAGMSEIDVHVGQFVLAGEPVAVMGARRIASAERADVPATDPSLYVEFRKDGKPVDPAPWWADRPSGRTGNDS